LGNPAYIKVIQFESDKPLYLYSHWGASKGLEVPLQNVLNHKQKWHDCTYIARMIMDELTRLHNDPTTIEYIPFNGFGIMTHEPDGDEYIINCFEESVTMPEGDSYSFEEYIGLEL
jgi:hypothetical protein